MAVDPTDIKLRLSVAAAAGDTTAGTIAGSLGDQVSTTVITTATLNNLFRDITGAEAAAGITLYKGIFVINDDATVTLENATIAINSETAGGGSIAVAADNIAASVKTSASAQMATIANETTSPGANAGAFGSSASIGNLPAGQVKGIWVRLTVAPGASAVSPDGVVLRVSGDTGP